MVQRVATVAFEGIEVRPVDVQVQVAAGLPAFTIVGLPDKAVSEARERVRSALTASGLALPARRITINLAPADLPKEGSHYDLPIALGLMAAIGAIPHDALSGFTVLGELGLDGSIAPVAGVLPAAIGANARGEGLMCPAACGPEGQRRSVALAHDDHATALAGLVFPEATVAAVFFVVRGLHVATKISAVDFNVARYLAIFHFVGECLAELVRQHEGRLVLAVEIAAQLQGAMAFGAVDEDRDCQEVVPNRELAAGEDRPGRDAELVRARFAFPELARAVAVEGRTAAPGAVRLARVVGPADQFERLIGFLIAHASHGR